MFRSFQRQRNPPESESHNPTPCQWTAALHAAALFDFAPAGWLETFRMQRITTQIILALEPPLCPPALRLLAGRFATLLLNERLLTLPLRLRCCRHDRFPLCTDIGILRLDCLLHSRLPCLFLRRRRRSAYPRRFGFSGADDRRHVAVGAGGRGIALG